MFVSRAIPVSAKGSANNEAPRAWW